MALAAALRARIFSSHSIFFLSLVQEKEKEQNNFCAKLLRSKIGVLCAIAIFLVQLLVCASPAVAQAVTWTQTDITSGSTGTFNYSAGNPPTYTIAGSGTGPGFVDSSETVVLTPAFGCCEIQGQVASQTNTGNGAVAGLCMRSGTPSYYSAEYVVGVTPANGIFFFRRAQYQGGGNIGTAAGSAPVYLKLRRYGDPANGFSYEGLYSADGINWTSLGTYTEVNTNPMPNKFYAGFVVSSSINGATQSTAVFDHVSYMTSVPQPSSNLMLWLRSDVGVTSSGGAVSSWADQSGNSNDATQSTGALKPNLTAGAANTAILPAISFDGSSQYLNLPTGFSNLSAGASVFAVIKPSSGVATGTPVTVGNTSNSDALIARTVGANAALFAFNSSTSSSVTTSSNPLSTSNFQVFEATFTNGASSGTGVGKVYVNGNLEATATNLVQNLNNTSRSSNFVGVGSGLTNYFPGDICEILVFSSPLSDSQRHSLESYFLSKFSVGATPTLDPPTISPSSGVFVPQQKIVMSQSQGAPVFYTFDGTTPSYDSLFFLNNTTFYLTNSGFTYLIPTLYDTTTVKAIATAPFFNDSPVTSELYTMDSSTATIPRSGLIQWLRSDNVLLSGSNVTTWKDISGSGNSASNASNQPTFVANAINGMPAINFSGSQFLQAPAGFSNFTSGLTAILMAKPSSVSAGARLFDYGNGATSDNIIMSLPSSTGLTFSTYNSSTSSSATASSGATLGNFQILESLYNGSNTATLFVNGTQAAQSTSMQTLNSLIRSNNFLGQDNSGGNRFNGQIAEMLLWNRQLSSAERTAVEGYLLSKYLQTSSNAVALPTFSISSTSFTEPSQVAIAAPTGAKIFVTTDGSTPTTSSQEYSKPVFVTYSQTVKAIAVRDGISSGVATESYTLDSTKWPAPSASDARTLDLKQQLPNVGIPHDVSQP